MSEETSSQTAPQVQRARFDLSPSVAILASGVLIASAILFVNYFPGAQQVAPPADVEESANVPAPSSQDHWRGSSDAPIVLVEYSDFQCPYCQMVDATLKQLVDESNGQVAWVYRHFPLESIHPQAQPAALASECVAEQLGNEGFWKFADELFANQTKLSPSYYAQVAASLGADAKKFSECVAAEKYAVKVDGQSLEAQQSGGTGTPYTVIIGAGAQIPLSGAQPIGNFRAVIQAMQARLQ